MPNYAEFHHKTLTEAEAFWGEQAKRIEWKTPPQTICDYSNPPFVKWFVGGTTNICHNAVDRHAAKRPNDAALIAISTETNTEKTYSFAELQREVERMAASLKSLGVQKGDRVLIYMPMIAEACFAMLACTRIGAIHSVVFGGFASGALATRIEDAQPKVVVSADGGSRGGKAIPYKPLLDEAIKLSKHKPESVLLVDRGLTPMNLVEGRDHLWADLRAKHMDAQVPCEWLEATTPSYTLYTSGTTGKPKGVQRDTGGYCVALATSIPYIYGGQPGETFFSTSDIGWVVGHSYIIYGPLIGGMATIMYEGLPTQGFDHQPDGGIWWRLVDKYKVSVMFSAPTAIRVLKKQDPEHLKKHDLSSLRTLFLAGEPLDEPTAKWISEGLDGKPIVDNYWQTETGWPILSVANGIEGVTPMAPRFGSPGVGMYGYNVCLINDNNGNTITQPDEKGVLMIEGPLPPGCLQTVWGDDKRFVNTYWTKVKDEKGKERWFYSTSDWAKRDADGYYFILGRTDDVINVAGHRLGTREIEESISAHPNVAEAGVVGIADDVKGQIALAFVTAKKPLESAEATAAFEKEILRQVDSTLGAVARPARVYVVNAMPKTRSGKLLRRTLQAVAEGRDPGDLSTIDDPASLLAIRDLIAQK
ncbi:MAG: propionate--CoA ligase [Brachymonas sp.]|jgi:propionyl-CoA synthetase|nr:propionate--CoA ligase [Brachymonas sp.]